ncbi:GATA transcription factor 18 [Linum grandiflorum]
MMHRCISGGVGGQCLCGMAYHCGGLQTNCSSSSSSSMFFNSDPPPPPPPPDHSYNCSSYQQTNYYNSCPSPSSSVDCTLSLGTPSTRLTIADDDHHHHNRTSSSSNNRRSSGNYVSNFCWDILKGGSSSSSKSRGNHNNNNQNNDPTLLARRCANCDTTSTPLWRNGPRGPKSLCNACGIRFKKEERRASAAAASSSSVQTMEHHQQQYYGYGAGTTSSSSSSSKMGCYSPAGEFRFIDDSSDVYDHQYQVVSDQTAGIPSFLSWRLNITDRPALVHDFTR